MIPSPLFFWCTRNTKIFARLCGSPSTTAPISPTPVLKPCRCLDTVHSISKKMFFGPWSGNRAIWVLEIGEIAGAAEVTIKQTYKLLYPRAVDLFPVDSKFAPGIKELPLSWNGWCGDGDEVVIGCVSFFTRCFVRVSLNELFDRQWDWFWADSFSVSWSKTAADCFGCVVCHRGPRPSEIYSIILNEKWPLSFLITVRHCHKPSRFL